MKIDNAKLVGQWSVEIANMRYLAARTHLRGAYTSVCEEYEAMSALPCTLFQAQLRMANACFSARIWVGGKSAREAWETCEDGTWMDWLVWRLAGTDVANMYTGHKSADEIRAGLPFKKLQELVAAYTARQDNQIEVWGAQ